MQNPSVGILTISDRVHGNMLADRGGDEIERVLKNVFVDTVIYIRKIVPDDIHNIQKALCDFSDDCNCALIISTGGTGPAPRDLTPEATAAICHKMLPGFGEAMRELGHKSTPTAILSRSQAGIRGKTLIVNLPGNPKAISESIEAIKLAIPHCLALIGAPSLQLRVPCDEAANRHAIF